MREEGARPSIAMRERADHHSVQPTPSPLMELQAVSKRTEAAFLCGRVVALSARPGRVLRIVDVSLPRIGGAPRIRSRGARKVGVELL